MRLKPLHDWAVIRPSKAKDKSVGGIIIPDTVKEQPLEGKIIAIGEGRHSDKDQSEKSREKTFVKTTLKPGDSVLFEKYAGRKITLDGEEVIIVREEDILGQLTR